MHELNTNPTIYLLSALMIHDIRYKYLDDVKPEFFADDYSRLFIFSMKSLKEKTKSYTFGVQSIIVEAYHLVSTDNKFKEKYNLNKDFPLFKSRLVQFENQSKLLMDEELSVLEYKIADIIKQFMMNSGINKIINGSKDAGVEEILKTRFITVSPFEIFDIGEFDTFEKLKKIDLPDSGKTIKSSMTLVNNNSLFKGFKNGDLVAWVAPPKVGKTTIMVQEGAHFAKQGHKVLHLFIGDMSVADGICKYISNLVGVNIDSVILNSKKYFEMCEETLNNVRMAEIASDSLTISEILHTVKKSKKEFNFDVLIVDYDSNIRPSQRDSLYERGGEIYSALKGFAAKEKCVVCVGSQPKIHYWTLELLDMTSASESSKKQHHVDFLLAIGRNQKFKHLGTLNMPLIRRGEGDVFTPIHFQYDQTRIQEISKDEYRSLSLVGDEESSGVDLAKLLQVNQTVSEINSETKEQSSGEETMPDNVVELKSVSDGTS